MPLSPNEFGTSRGAHRRQLTALTNAKAIVHETDLPIASDLENGFGHAPEVAAETIRFAAEPAGRRSAGSWS